MLIKHTINAEQVHEELVDILDKVEANHGAVVGEEMDAQSIEGRQRKT